MTTAAEFGQSVTGVGAIVKDCDRFGSIVQFHNATIADSICDGVGADTESSTLNIGSGSTGVSIVNNTFRGAHSSFGGASIFRIVAYNLNDITGLLISGNVVVDCTSTYAAQISSAAADHIVATVTGNVIEGSTLRTGIQTAEATGVVRDCLVTGNQIEALGREGIYWTGNDSALVDNHLANNRQDAATSYDQLRVHGDRDNIQMNKVRGTQAR